MQNTIVVLHKHKSEAVRRFHPWIFSGAIKEIKGAAKDGDIVEVQDERGNVLGTGHYANGSIAVRLFAFGVVESFEILAAVKVAAAFKLRQAIHLTDNGQTNCFRLIHGEGDGLPGLIVDVYGATAVLQAHSEGMYRARQAIAEAIVKEVPLVKAVYCKSAATLGLEPETDGYLLGREENNTVAEYGHQFEINWQLGQKTGFFLDQRENRHLLAKYAKGKNVLNTFCYSGGFSVYALKAGAATVVSVDSSAKAIDWTNRNVALNGETTAHTALTADVMHYFKEVEQDQFNLMVLDPPAFAKHQSARHKALQAYQRLNKHAFDKIAPGGIVFTFSCSQAVSQELFEGAVTAAAIESRCNIKILHRLTQPADHPVSAFHPEGEYLKGLVLWVE
jgi:23S rRNA (cytosine1962-C5)-methyltransferase